jgi:Pycsar effector protein
MGRLATDPNQAQDALVRDLYQQGRMLAERKYRYLRICYRVVFFGILASGLVGGWELLKN